MLDNIFHILVRPTLEKFIILLLDNLASADAILNSNLNIPLRGAAIGNGWIDGRSGLTKAIGCFFARRIGTTVEVGDVR